MSARPEKIDGRVYSLPSGGSCLVRRFFMTFGEAPDFTVSVVLGVTRISVGRDEKAPAVVNFAAASPKKRYSSTMSIFYVVEEFKPGEKPPPLPDAVDGLLPAGGL